MTGWPAAPATQRQAGLDPDEFPHRRIRIAQQGYLYPNHGSWFVRYWETVRNPDGSLSRKNPAHRLASVKDYPRRADVIPLKNRFMERLNRIGFTPETGISLVDFAEKAFFSACEQRLSGAGTKCYRDTWNSHLRKHVIGIRLRDVRPFHVQNLLNLEGETYGRKLAHSTYKTMKVTLSAILTEARNLGLYDGVNPTTGVRIPKGRKHGRKRLAYGLEEILKHLELFSSDPIVIATEDGPYTPVIRAGVVRAIIGVAGLGGLRLGEIRGLWWEDDRQDVLAICRSMWRSTLKNTKTDEDIDDPGLVPIIQPLRLLLDAIKPKGAAGFIFLNRIRGALDLDNLARRVIKPTLEAQGLKWKGWQAYRRGLATNLKELGVPDTTIQCILRHENVSTTQRFYIKTAPKAAKAAMRKLERKIGGCTALVQQASVNGPLSS
jgi:integrase